MKELINKHNDIDPYSEENWNDYIIESPLYNIKMTHTDSFEMRVVDFNEQNNVSLISDKIKLETESIEIENDLNKSIINFLNKKFVKMARDNGYKNRDFKDIPRNDDGEIRFDIDIEKLKEDMKKNPPIDNNIDLSIIRKITARLNMASSWIAVTGRIGPGRYIICNEFTNNYLKKIFEETSYTFFELFVDNSIEDGELVMGRKNSSENPGILAIIDQNSLQNTLYNKEEKLCVNLCYSLQPIGFYPEKQYLTLKIKIN